MNDAAIYLRRSASTGLINAFTSAICVVVVLPLIIGSLGLDAYGSWAVLGVFVGVASLLDLGMTKALVFLIPRAEQPAGTWFSAAVCVCLAATTLVAGSIVVLATLGVPLFGEHVARHPGLTLWLACAGVIVLVCQMLTTLVRAVLEGRCKAHWVNAGFASFTVAYYLAGLLASWWLADVRLVIGVSAGIYVLTLAAHLQLLWRSGPLQWQWPGRATLKALVRVSGRTFAVDLPSIAYLPMLLWIFMLVAHSGSAYGVFDIATRIATLCGTALASLSVPFYALVAGARDGERQQVREMLERFLPWKLACALAAWLLFVLLGERVLQWWMPEAYTSLASALRWLLAGALAYAAFEPITRMLLGLGYIRQLLMIRLAMVAVCAFTAMALHSWDPLLRFSLAGAAGWASAAILLALAARRVRWGQAQVS